MKYYRSGKRRAIAVLSAVSVGAATAIGLGFFVTEYGCPGRQQPERGELSTIFSRKVTGSGLLWTLCGQNIPIGRLWRSIPDYPGVTVLHLLIKPMNMKCSLPEI